MGVYSAYYVIKFEDSIFKEMFFGHFEFVENVLVVDLVITLPIILASILSFFGVMFKKGLILVMVSSCISNFKVYPLKHHLLRTVILPK